jgi:hypothetical protein
MLVMVVTIWRTLAGARPEPAPILAPAH